MSGCLITKDEIGKKVGRFINGRKVLEGKDDEEREGGQCVSRKRLGNEVERKEGEHWLKSPTKVEVRSERLEREGEKTLAPIADGSRGAIRTSGKGRR